MRDSEFWRARVWCHPRTSVLSRLVIVGAGRCLTGLIIQSCLISSCPQLLTNATRRRTRTRAQRPRGTCRRGKWLGLRRLDAPVLRKRRGRYHLHRSRLRGVKCGMRRNSFDCFVGVHRLSAAFQIRRTLRRPRVSDRPRPATLRLPRSSSCRLVRHPSLRLSLLFIHHKLRINVLRCSRARLLPFFASNGLWLFVRIVRIECRRECYQVQAQESDSVFSWGSQFHVKSAHLNHLHVSNSSCSVILCWRRRSRK